MELPVNVAQTVSGDVRVNFRRADVRVAQQFLNHPQIRAVLQQMCRKTVPQHVRRDVAFDARALHAILDVFPERVRGEGRSSLCQENCGGRFR